MDYYTKQDLKYGIPQVIIFISLFFFWAWVDSQLDPTAPIDGPKVEMEKIND